MNKKCVPRFAFLLTALLWAAISLSGCNIGFFFRSTECADIADMAGDAFTTVTLNGTRWMYQLQNADPDEVGATDFDILVIDYSSNGEETGRYTSTEMATFKTSGENRQVLAYLSIGEAEDYRYYFEEDWIASIGKQPSDDAPCWLGRTNPDWEGNYKVQYWSDAWQLIILDYLDTIIEDGFDGVYLDIIDAYEYWADEDNNEGFSLGEDVAAARMINFVKRIAYYARVTKGVTDFLVFPQNGAPILAYDDGIYDLGANDYLNTISGIGIEDLYYNETEAVEASATSDRKAYLDQISAAGKKVLVVDYVDDGSGSSENNNLIAAFRSTASGDGYYPYAATTDRELAAINLQP